MIEAGALKVEARVVREGDQFEYSYGIDSYLRHQPKPGSNAAITGAYAIIWLRGGVQQFEYMTAEEIDAIRKQHSKQWKSGPLPKWYARKTVIRQIVKYVPRKTGRIASLMKRDEIDPASLEAVEASQEMLQQLTSGRNGDRPREQLPVHSEGYEEPARQPSAVTEAQSSPSITEEARRQLYAAIEDRDISGLTKMGDHEALHVLLRQVRGLKANAEVHIVADQISQAEHARMLELIDKLPVAPEGSKA
jgi:recombinational DNA repair protein RecT